MPHGIAPRLCAPAILPRHSANRKAFTPLFYAHIGAGHQDRKLLSCKHIVISSCDLVGIKKVSSKNLMFFKKTSVISCYHFSSSVPHSTDLFGSVTLSAVTGGSCRSLAFTVCSVPCPFGAPLRSHLLHLSVSFLSACRNVLCKTSIK